MHVAGAAWQHEPASNDQIVSTGIVKEWEVVHSRVAYREEPSTNGQVVGVARCGEIVRGVVQDVGGVGWLRIRARDTKYHGIKQWKVVQIQARVKDTMFRNAATIEIKTKGTLVLGVQDREWIRLTSELGYMKIRDGNQLFLQAASERLLWMLIHGESVGCGLLLKPVVVRRCRTPGCRFIAHSRPEDDWVGFCCGACCDRSPGKDGSGHGLRCERRIASQVSELRDESTQSMPADHWVQGPEAPPAPGGRPRPEEHRAELPIAPRALNTRLGQEERRAEAPSAPPAPSARPGPIEHSVEASADPPVPGARPQPEDREAREPNSPPASSTWPELEEHRLPAPAAPAPSTPPDPKERQVQEPSPPPASSTWPEPGERWIQALAAAPAPSTPPDPKDSKVQEPSPLSVSSTWPEPEERWIQAPSAAPVPSTPPDPKECWAQAPAAPSAAGAQPGQQGSPPFRRRPPSRPPPFAPQAAAAALSWVPPVAGAQPGQGGPGARQAQGPPPAAPGPASWPLPAAGRLPAAPQAAAAASSQAKAGASATPTQSHPASAIRRPGADTWLLYDPSDCDASAEMHPSGQGATSPPTPTPGDGAASEHARPASEQGAAALGPGCFEVPVRFSMAPPRPLTTEWLTEQACLAINTASVQTWEEPVALGPNSDVGMASEVKVLRVGAFSYVLKRCKPGGEDLAQLRNEFRFYTEICPREAVPAERDLSRPTLDGALGLARCVLANMLPTAASKGRQAKSFLLVLEFLTTPSWQRVDPSMGCSDTQAFACAEALARFHACFMKSERIAKLEWLPLISWKIPRHYSRIDLSWLLPFVSVRAFRICSQLRNIKLGEWAEKRLESPPLTLLHGDLKVDNLRFAPGGGVPAVAAFDWGMVSRGRAAYDAAHFIMMSGPPKSDRRNKLKFHYREALMSAGGSGIAGLEDDLRAACCLILMRHAVMCLYFLFYTPDEKKYEAMLLAVQRAAATAEEWDVDLLLDRL